MINFARDKRVLITNFLSLSALQGVNMVLPLIVLPYVVRVLDVENFGLISFALSIIMYFNLLVSFGFDLSATRQVSIYREDSKKVEEIFSAVMLIKFCLVLISFLVLCILLYVVNSMRANASLYLTTFGIVIGNALFPSWLFQGMEQMKHITYVKVTTGVLFSALIFLFVRDSSDYAFVPLLNSIGSITAGFYALHLVHKLFSVKLVKPRKKELIFQLKNSSHFFLSRVANNGSRYYATTLVGLFFGNIMVGYYVMAEKLFYAFMSLGGVLSQTLYPYMSRTRNIEFYKKVLLVVSLISVSILVPLILFREYILDFVFNVDNDILSNIFLIVFSGALFGILSIMTGYPLLAAFGFINHANNSLIYTSLIYMIYISIVTLLTKNIYLVASSLLAFNAISLIFRVYYIKKENLM